MKAANNYDINEGYSFFHTSDVSCASDFVSEGGTSIVLFRNFDESPLKFTGNEEELIAFAKKSSVPRLITFSE